MTRLAVTLAVALVALAACGKRGGLQQPAPMWEAKPAATATSDTPPATATPTPPAAAAAPAK